MSSEDTILLLYPVISSCGDSVSAHQTHLRFFPIKVNDITIKI